MPDAAALDGFQAALAGVAPATGDSNAAGPDGMNQEGSESSALSP